MKDQDIYLPLGGLRAHEVGVQALWQWLQDNWTTLQEKLPPGLTLLSSVVQMCTSGFTKKGKIDDIKRFFDNKSTKGFDQGLAQSLDSISAKASWLERDGDDIQKWLKANGYLSDRSSGEL